MDFNESLDRVCAFFKEEHGIDILSEDQQDRLYEYLDGGQTYGKEKENN